MTSLLDYPLDYPGASIATARDLLAMSASYGCVAALVVMFATFPYWSV